MAELVTKRCTGECQRELPLTSFGPGKRPGSHHPRCRDCQAAYCRRRRAARPDFQERQRLRDALADLAAEGLKRCANPGCHQILPVSEFYRASRCADGYQPYCKKCMDARRAANRPSTTKPSPSTSYGAVHSRLGALSGQPCSICGGTAEEWSYDHTDPDELTSDSGFPYSLDLSRYEPMCRRCHRRYDSEFRRPERSQRIASRPLVPRNVCVICGASFLAPKRRIQSCSAPCESKLRALRQRQRHQQTGAGLAGMTPIR